MFYAVAAIYTFTSHDEARDFFHDCIMALPKTAVIPNIEPYSNCPEIKFHQCFHDELPAKPCLLLGNTSGLLPNP